MRCLFPFPQRTLIRWPSKSTSARPSCTTSFSRRPESRKRRTMARSRAPSSVAGIMPAIAYYLPHTRVVPLVIRGDAGPDDAARLGRALASQLDGNTVLVAAVGFSHDLVSSAAQRNDAVTLQALRAGDSATLFTLDNRYLDSPESIAVLMASMASDRGVHFLAS